MIQLYSTFETADVIKVRTEVLLLQSLFFRSPFNPMLSGSFFLRPTAVQAVVQAAVHVSHQLLL